MSLRLHGTTRALLFTIFTYTGKELANVDVTGGVVRGTLTSEISRGLVSSLLIVDQKIFFFFFCHSVFVALTLVKSVSFDAKLSQALSLNLNYNN